ncbi:DDB1- and CUL4-associated factor 8 isoform X2 [Cephus cinctus]|uniref:DDB1- and CUL4-associated factor 8 isoform X2 n=1 Tax=Cephus cinctus TaxID=211228 RepID=A0AAJ7C4E4_CEPCN|nr:DDB1- and CUL4-associated factor 8 isoform X2 [Cephus cinctus]
MNMDTDDRGKDLKSEKIEPSAQETIESLETTADTKNTNNVEKSGKSIDNIDNTSNEILNSLEKSMDKKKDLTIGNGHPMNVSEMKKTNSTRRLSNENDPHTSSSDQSSSKRSISIEPGSGDTDTSMEKSGNSSEEDSSKRQRTSESPNDLPTVDDNCAGSSARGNTSLFHKLKFKVKNRNYRMKEYPESEFGEGSNQMVVDESISKGRVLGVGETSNGQNTVAQANDDSDDDNIDVPLNELLEHDSDSSSDNLDQEGKDDSNEWTTASEEDLDEEEAVMRKQKPKPNWLMVQEIINRQLGNNPLFQRKFYGSLHVVERLELMYKLKGHQGCVNALSFNQKGNLIASGSDDLEVVIWDWATGNSQRIIQSAHRSNIFQVKWLPLDMEYLLVTAARDGQIRLNDLHANISKKLASHRGACHKISTHPDTPHVVLSAGEDAKVLSIDVRRSKPTKLLTVREASTDVRLYSIHSNPLNSNEFCVGGRDHYVRVYDRRKVTIPLYKLCPRRLIGNKYAHITCAVYNYNGTEILASYNDEDIYLFDLSVTQSGEDFAQRYQGHRNNATVKGVNFFGPKSEFIISGSDCGNIYIWDKNTEAIVKWMLGDEQGVVNVLEPHPHIPILATSGLDYDVKIWIPSDEKVPDMTGLQNCIKSNLRRRAEDTACITSNVFAGHMRRFLQRHMRRTVRVRNYMERLANQVPDTRMVTDMDSSSDNDSSTYSGSQSDFENDTRIQCAPS